MIFLIGVLLVAIFVACVTIFGGLTKEANPIGFRVVVWVGIVSFGSGSALMLISLGILIARWLP